MKKLILIILSLLLISMYGCAKRQTQTSFDSSSTSRVVEKPKPKYAEVTVVRDDFQKKTTFTGNSVDGQSVDGLSADGLSMNILLSGSKVDTYPNVDAVVQIYVSSHYKSKDWRSYETAYDSDGTRYETVHISHDASSCSERGCISEVPTPGDCTTSSMK